MPDDGVGKLIVDLKDESRATRFFTVLNLGETENPRAIQPLKDLLKIEKNKSVWEAIRGILEKLSQKYKSDAEGK